MNKFRKILLICLAACFAVACAAAVACSSAKNFRAPQGGVANDGSVDANNPGGDLPFYYPEGEDPNQYADKGNAYYIYTKSVGGIPISDVHITVKQEGETIIEGVSKDGVAAFNIPFDYYELEYPELPLGYSVDPVKTVTQLTPESTTVTTAFNSTVIGASVPMGKQYRAGELMYDFSVTDADGVTMRLSDLLQHKLAVVINFWATWCGQCIAEFPALNGAYNLYSDKVEVIAISEYDNNDGARAFKQSSNIDFFMAHDSPGLFNHFDTAGIPVSVIVDRYGLIAYYEIGSEQRQMAWEALFAQFTANDYTQTVQEEDLGNSSTGSDPVAPPEGFEHMPADDAMNQALLHSDIASSADLHFYEPAEGSRDRQYNWPFLVKDDDPEGAYIAPSNLGTDNSWSIVYTDVELQKDQTLSVEVKMNTDVDDFLYIIMNNNAATTFTWSGATSGWIKAELFSSTRHTAINLAIMYYKSPSVTPADEFVGLRNLNITDRDYNTTEPNDVRTEAVNIVDGEPVYPTVYMADDGFYHIREGVEQNPATDSILFADILSESLWTDRHIANMRLYYSENDQSYEVPTKSVYLVSYWHPDFGDAANKGLNEKLNFQYGETNTDTIIDNYWIQDGTTYMAAVDETLATALKAFAERAYNYIDEYENGYDADKTWLELCSYYRTLGGDHSKEGHNCLAHFNPGEGKTLTYAYELTLDERTTVDLTVAQRKNRAGGMFYKFTAPSDGVYAFSSYREYSMADPIDPNLIMWSEGSDCYNDPPITSNDDDRRAVRFLDNEDNQHSNNFCAIVYLTAGTTVYPQLTVSQGDISESVPELLQQGYDLTYEVDVKRLGDTKHVLTMATIDGSWIGDSSQSVYGTIDTYLEDDGLYYHILPDESRGSVIYIEFLHSGFSTQASLELMIDRGVFNFSQTGGGNFTSQMREYLEEATAKDPSDPTYGMLEATQELVSIISAGFQAMSSDGDGLDSGLWKDCAYYYQYYGPTSWEELPAE